MPDPITIKGIREGLLVTVGDAETWPITAQGLLTRIDETADFFKGAKLALAIGGRAISAARLGPLRDDLPARKVRFWAVLSGSAPTVSAAPGPGLHLSRPTPAPAHPQ